MLQKIMYRTNNKRKHRYQYNNVSVCIALVYTWRAMDHEKLVILKINFMKAAFTLF